MPIVDILAHNSLFFFLSHSIWQSKVYIHHSFSCWHLFILLYQTKQSLSPIANDWFLEGVDILSWFPQTTPMLVLCQLDIGLSSFIGVSRTSSLHKRMSRQVV